MKPSERAAILRTIAEDVAVIKKEIASLRVKVAVVSSTVAFVVTLVTGMLFNELSKPRLATDSFAPKEERRVEIPEPPHIPGGSK
jgi:prophage DNA circulation protein